MIPPKLTKGGHVEESAIKGRYQRGSKELDTDK